MFVKGVHHTTREANPLGKRTEAEGTPSTLPQPTFTKQTYTKSNNTSTSQQHPSPQIHSSSQPTRSVHRDGHGIACSTSHDNPSQVMLPKSRPSISPRSNHTKTTAFVKPSTRTSNVANNEQQRRHKQPLSPKFICGKII